MVMVAAASAMVAPGALAQQYFDPGVIQNPILQKPGGYEALGTRLGGFMFWPSAELSYVDNDNVFYDEETEASDAIWHLRPRFNLASDWSRHSLNLAGWADIARYADFSELDYEDWGLRLDGRVDVRHDSYFSYELSTMELHEDRRSPDARLGLFPTDFDYGGWGLGYDHTFNRMKVGGYLRRNAFDFDDTVTSTGGLLGNQDRDRDETTGTLRVDFLARPGRSYFLSWGWTEVDYDLRLDNNGFARSSDGSTLTAGINWDLTGVLVGELSGAWSTREYDDPALPDVEGFNLGAGLTWHPSRLTTVNLRLAGGPQETRQADVAGYFSRLYSARVQHELRRNVLLHLRGSYTDNDYEPVPGAVGTLLDTEVYRADLGVSYLINRHLSLTGGYGIERQESSEPLFEYRSDRFFLTLGVEL